MDFVEYGNKDGNFVVYFHGVPGALGECAVFDRYAKDLNLNIVCFDRFAIDNSLDRESYYLQLLNQIKIKAGGKLIDIIGFSIGSYIALEIGARLNDQVRQTHLVSGVAPINADNFIGNMAGGLVFKLAMEKPLVFTALTRYQTIMALLAPRMLVSILFASSDGKDKELSKRHDFKRYITPVLKHCFQNRANGYMRDINLYVTWPANLDRYTSSVHLWHGTKDNWSPFSMSTYLCDAIPGATRVEAMEGLSHYSCLYEAAPKICAQLAK